MNPFATTKLATPISRVSRLLKALLFGLFLVYAHMAQAGVPPWADAPYTYFVQNKNIDKVLQDFAGSFSLSLRLGRGVEGVVNGRFNTKNPTEFINKLSSVYGFTWFTHAGTLYVSRTDDVQTTLVPLVSMSSSSQLRDALTSLGVLDQRFGWGELPDQGVALISGPPAYVELIEKTIRLLPSVAGGQQVAVFRLKHASVDDRVIFFRDKEITTPGLMNILRNLVSNSSGGNNRSGINNEALTAIAAPLRAAPPAVFVEGTNAAAPSAPANAHSAPSAGSQASGNRVRSPSIQGDIRLNSLIVQDIPERIPVYERLIRELDVPTALIEIQAMVVDVNSQRMEELGINWGGRANKSAFGYGDPGNVPAAGTLSLNWSKIRGAVSPSTLAVESANFLVTRIRLLEGIGDANVRSTPSVLTLDNQGALFDHSQTFYVRVQGERVASVTPVTAGTTLRVTPRVIDNDGKQQVQMVVDIEDGKIQDSVVVDTIPTVQRSSISTQAVVNDNETMVIGGYNNEQDIQRVDRIPVLGEIPLLGALFSNRTVDRQKRERLFLIKPRIVTLPTITRESLPIDVGALQIGKKITAKRIGSPYNKLASASSPAGFPRVGENTQKFRDSDRKRILEQELSIEQKNLSQAKRDLTEQEAATNAIDKNTVADTSRLQAFKDRVVQHERNILAIGKELSMIK
ncbi:MAG: Type secretion outerrane pore forming protein [Proteobacteria bacterium]|nr:Type secretion outerrane pore forming protein [Pseudomonadota bacterium]